MAWTSPVTWAAQALTAALLNQQLRDNMNETAPGIATAGGRLIVTDAANSVVERIPGTARENTIETTTSTTFTDLATVGPAVTVTTGTQALVCVYSQLQNNTATNQAFMSFAISGATTTAALDDFAIGFQAPAANGLGRIGACFIVSLTAGSNVFTAKYRVSGGTGTFHFRHVHVIPF